MPNFIYQITQGILDLIYPPKCGLCGHFGLESLCCICSGEFQELNLGIRRATQLNSLDYWVSLYLYRNHIAQAIKRLKYQRVTSLAKPLADLLYEGALNLGLLNVDVIIPIPIHWRRKFDRGFNQTELLCKSMPKNLIETNLVKRIKHTLPQVTLTNEERLMSLEGAFWASSRVQGLSVLLVDDVMTSGGTAYACSHVLKEAGAREVGILCLAGR